MKPITLAGDGPQPLYEQARARMSEALPGWRDDLPSDPAAAVLELFALLSDAQNTALDQVTDRHRLAFLRLLGGAVRQRAPARLFATAAGGVYPGQRFHSGGIPFEVETPPARQNRVVQAVLTRDGESVPMQPGVPLALTGEWSLEVTLAEPLHAGETVRLWCGVLPEEGRNPPEDDTPAPFSLRCRILENRAWRPVALRDQTCGLLRPGFLSLCPPVQGSCLRLFPDGAVEGVPRLSSLAFEPALLVQRRTRSAVADLLPPFRLPPGWEGERVLRFFLPDGDGWREAEGVFLRDGCAAGFPQGAPERLRVCAAEPDFRASYPLRAIAEEEIPLREAGILPGSLRLMAESGGVWHDVPVCEPEAGKTLPAGCRWEEAKHSLCFGDGRSFRIPGEGQLLITACACTLGAAANGAGGVFEDGVGLAALYPAQGGQDAEPAEAAFFRTAAEQELPLRIVTCADCEALARRAPGLRLERVRAVTRRSLGRAGAGLIVFAKPSGGGSLTGWQRERLGGWLERFRLIGVPVEVRSPRILPVSVTVSLEADGGAEEPALRAAVLREADGLAGPLDFGAVLSPARLHAAVGAVPHVLRVRSLELRPLSPGAVRTADGGLRLPADALPRLAGLQIRYTHDR